MIFDISICASLIATNKNKQFHNSFQILIKGWKFQINLEEGKDQESIQSTSHLIQDTTWESDKTQENKMTKHKKTPHTRE